MPSTPSPSGADHARRWLIAAAVVVVLAAVAVWWFLSSTAPAAVDIASAADQVAGSASADDTSATADGDTWVVDTSIAPFSITESTGTFVGARIDEELSNIGATTAVIRTPAVEGTITLDGTTLAAADIEADFTQLVSDESRREDNVQEALNTTEHPTATFTLTDPIDLDALPTTDTPVDVTATGELTIAGVTNVVDVPLQIAMVDDVAVVTGTLDIALADYDVQAPSAPIVLSVADTATVELQLYLTAAS
jgi:polyisoprenoid-binding protein YceI